MHDRGDHFVSQYRGQRHPCEWTTFAHQPEHGALFIARHHLWRQWHHHLCPTRLAECCAEWSDLQHLRIWYFSVTKLNRDGRCEMAGILIFLPTTCFLFFSPLSHLHFRWVAIANRTPGNNRSRSMTVITCP
jgi:hypothetical protein